MCFFVRYFLSTMMRRAVPVPAHDRCPHLRGACRSPNRAPTPQTIFNSGVDLGSESKGRTRAEREEHGRGRRRKRAPPMEAPTPGGVSPKGRTKASGRRASALPRIRPPRANIGRVRSTRTGGSGGRAEAAPTSDKIRYVYQRIHTLESDSPCSGASRYAAL